MTADAMAAFVAAYGPEPDRRGPRWAMWESKQRGFLAAYSSRQAVIDAQAARIAALEDGLRALVDMDVAYQRGPLVEDAVEIARALLAAEPAKDQTKGGSNE